MKINLFLAMAVMACSAAICACDCYCKKPDASVTTQDAKTVYIENLQAAYNGESNASAKYAFYAEKADEAGYKSVATMFRATSKAESIHAEAQAALIKSLGAEPKKEIKLPEYVDVATSLKDGIKGETYEFETMYPGFLKHARDTKADIAIVRAFENPMEAEKGHAKMYQDVLNDLENWKAEGKVLAVCEICGFTAVGDAPKSCPICMVPAEKFIIFK